MTTNVKPRLLTLSEIELWELAQRAANNLIERSWDSAAGWRQRTYIYDDEAAFFEAASPDKVTALLETLEKTRRLLDELTTDAERLLDDGPHPDDTPPDFPERVHRAMVLYDNLTATTSIARALLSGFSGDASKEEK